MEYYLDKLVPILILGAVGAFLALSGVWKDDPYLDEMLKEIYKKRGRPMVEDK